MRERMEGGMKVVVLLLVLEPLMEEGGRERAVEFGDGS